MRAQALAGVAKYLREHEGYTTFMYCDVLNLVTTGIGNLIDDGPKNGNAQMSFAARAALNTEVSANAMKRALALPWRTKGPGWKAVPGNPSTQDPVGDLVSQQAKADAWTVVKTMNARSPGFAQKGGFAYADLTALALSKEDVATLVTNTQLSFERTLISRYPGFANAPSDAQMATMIMAWAMGPAFNFPAFKVAFDKEDFAKAGELSFFQGGGGSLNARTGRNADNVVMFNNAAAVVKAGADRDRLFFPGTGPTAPGNVGPGSPLVASVSPFKPSTTTVVAAGAAVAGWFGWKWWKNR